jgi:hypothetical protein
MEFEDYTTTAALKRRLVALQGNLVKLQWELDNYVYEDVLKCGIKITWEDFRRLRSEEYTKV